jgi:hypothetical protein
MGKKKKTPVKAYKRIKVDNSGDPGYMNRILIGHPVTGNVRIEWVQARYGQVIPVNWGQVEMIQGIPTLYPLGYQVADAQNIIVAKAIEKGFEWLLLWEHDVLPPPNSIQSLNVYMREERVPIVSGLYFTRSRPPEPLIFRGRGVGAFYDWEMGDRVWCDGVPTGFLLVHMGILREMWADAEEYEPVHGKPTRRIFITPRDVWQNPVTGEYNTMSGTSDLDWCTRVIEGEYFARAGWDEFQDKRYPFLVDTKSLYCKHINPDGEQFP